MKIEHVYTIKKIRNTPGREHIAVRLMDLGLIEGVRFCFLQRLPLGGIWIVSAGALYIALRDEEIGEVDFE